MMPPPCCNVSVESWTAVPAGQCQRMDGHLGSHSIYASDDWWACLRCGLATSWPIWCLDCMLSRPLGHRFTMNIAAVGPIIEALKAGPWGDLICAWPKVTCAWATNRPAGDWFEGTNLNVERHAAIR